MALTKIGKEGVTGISNSSNATAITIDSSENVGIGVASMTNKLVLPNASYFAMQDSSGAESLAIRANSSNTMEILTGGGVKVNIDSSGRVTMPSQPRFFCGPSSSATMSNSTSALTQIAFDTETIDRGGNFASNTFTAPVTGDYLLHFQLRVDSVDIAALYYYFYIETSNRNYQSIQAPHWASDPEYNHFALTVIADMDASDTATVKYQQYSGTDNHATIIGGDLRYTHFSGYLLG